MKDLALSIVFLTALCTINLKAQSFRYSEWRSVPCFEGIQFRTRLADYNNSAKKYDWKLQFRNLYQQRVGFGFAMKENSQALKDYVVVNGGWGRQTLKAGEADVLETFMLLPSDQSVSVAVGYVRFLGADDVDTGGFYATCTQAGIRGQIDFLCYHKPQMGCTNYKKPDDKTVAGTSTKSASAVQPQASAEYCAALFKDFNADPNEANLRISKDIKAGDELVNRCRNAFTPELYDWIKRNAANLKQIAKERNIVDQDIDSNTTQNSDLSAQSNAQKDDYLMGLKKKYVEMYQKADRNKEMNVQFSLSPEGQFQVNYKSYKGEKSYQFEFKWLYPYAWNYGDDGTSITDFYSADEAEYYLNRTGQRVTANDSYSTEDFGNTYSVRFNKEEWKQSYELLKVIKKTIKEGEPK